MYSFLHLANQRWRFATSYVKKCVSTIVFDVLCEKTQEKMFGWRTIGRQMPWIAGRRWRISWLRVLWYSSGTYLNGALPSIGVNGAEIYDIEIARRRKEGTIPMVAFCALEIDVEWLIGLWALGPILDFLLILFTTSSHHIFLFTTGSNTAMHEVAWTCPFWEFIWYHR